MTEFSEQEKRALLEAAKSQSKIHTFLMGMNGEPGFCSQVNERLDKIDTKLDYYSSRHHKLDKKVQWLIGVLTGLGIVSGGTIGVIKLLGG